MHCGTKTIFLTVGFDMSQVQFMRSTCSELVGIAIGGLDPTGAAGILLDAAVFRAMGVHGAAVNTLTTVQDSERFVSAQAQSGEAVGSAVDRICETTYVRAVKTGALGNREIVMTIAKLAKERGFNNLVVDPVLRSTTGGELLDDDGIDAMIKYLLPVTAVVTPNLFEAERLTGQLVNNVDTMLKAARCLVQMGARAALVKGGHLDVDDAAVVDVYVERGGLERVFRGQRHSVGEVRGTGCALASTIAALLGRRQELIQAIENGRKYLSAAIKNSVHIGSGTRVLYLGNRE
jgi:hydroxymethylpyrimidine/phosphomethylpyrimidine kinase